MIARRAAADEADALARLQSRVTRFAYRRIFPPDACPPSVGDLAGDWSAALSRTDRCVLVVDGDTDLVALCETGPDDDEPETGRIFRLHVDPEHWGFGIGRMLHGACIEHWRCRGWTAGVLWVLEGNSRARAWYERLGWRDTGRRRSVYAPACIDALAYELIVSGRSA